MNDAAPGSERGLASPPSELPSSSHEVALRLLALQQQLIDAIDRAHQQLLLQQDRIIETLTTPQVVMRDDDDEPRNFLSGKPISR